MGSTTTSCGATETGGDGARTSWRGEQRRQADGANRAMCGGMFRRKRGCDRFARAEGNRQSSNHVCDFPLVTPCARFEREEGRGGLWEPIFGRWI